jgi:hypothetical protein
MTKKQQKKVNHLIKMQFKNLLVDAIRLPLKSRLRICRIILFKNISLITPKEKNHVTTKN